MNIYHLHIDSLVYVFLPNEPTYHLRVGSIESWRSDDDEYDVTVVHDDQYGEEAVIVFYNYNELRPFFLPTVII